jgi:hypothetical protein
MMLLLMSICIAMTLIGFVLSDGGRDAIASLTRGLGLRDERNNRPVTRTHAAAAAGIGRQRAFGKR